LKQFPKENFWICPIAAVSGVSDSFGDANRGVECTLSLSQDQAVRTASKLTPTGLRAQLGNFEPFKITRILIGVQEENS